MKSVYNEDVSDDLEAGAELSAVSYDPTQEALVMSRTATVGGKVVTAEINGIATGKGEDGTVNMWLSAFQFTGPDGQLRKVPGLNAVAKLAPRQGAIETARAIANRFNKAGVYRARATGDRRKAKLNIVFTGKGILA